VTNTELLRRLHDISAPAEVMAIVEQYVADQRKGESKKKRKWRMSTGHKECPPDMSTGHLKSQENSSPNVHGTSSPSFPGFPSLPPLILSPITTLPSLPSSPKDISPKKAATKGKQGSKTSSDWKADPIFRHWYAAYPRHVAPAHAYRAWLKASKNTSVEVLQIAADSFAKECRGREAEFIPYPSTWLNGGRWADGESAEPVNPAATALIERDRAESARREALWRANQGNNGYDHHQGQLLERGGEVHQDDLSGQGSGTADRPRRIGGFQGLGAVLPSAFEFHPVGAPRMPRRT
jgi:hypothetical protein